MKETNKLKKKKLNQGITLVSLVVTIIILIILAGISINLTLGEEGIFTLAQRAKENTELAQIEEQEKLNALYKGLDFNTEGEGVTGGLYDAIGEFRKFKEKIAQAIQDAGGIPPENPILADADAFKERIVGEKGIVAEVTKDATATEEDIAEGKTAWVKGKQITGTKTGKNLDSITFQMTGYSTNYGSTCTINTYDFKFVTLSGYTNDKIIIKINDTTHTVTKSDLSKAKFQAQEGQKIDYDISGCESFTMRCNGSDTLGILTLHN